MRLKQLVGAALGLHGLVAVLWIGVIVVGAFGLSAALNAAPGAYEEVVILSEHSSDSPVTTKGELVERLGRPAVIDVDPNHQVLYWRKGFWVLVTEMEARTLGDTTEFIVSKKHLLRHSPNVEIERRKDEPRGEENTPRGEKRERR